MRPPNWQDPALGGGLFEKIVACLLLREWPEAVRIVPARGDGGVDIFVPITAAEIDVYQCKHFKGDIRWDQVEESLSRLADGKWLGRSVRNWHLVVPKQPTLKTQATFDSKTKASPFFCHWLGEDKLHSLAMDSPQVINYYLGDGKRQLQRLVSDWENVAAQIRAEQSPSMKVIEPKLRELADVLGRNDPHLRYGISVKPHAPTTDELSAPGLVAAQTVESDGQVVTQFVYARYRGAAEDAAERLHARFLVKDGPGRRKLNDLLSLGGTEPVVLTADDLADLELPTFGLPHPSESSVSIAISPAVISAPEVLRLAFRSPAGDEHRFRFTRSSLSLGHSGSTSLWDSPGKLFSLEIKLDAREERVDFRFHPTRPSINPPIINFAHDLQLMRAASTSTEIRFAAPVGSIWTESIPLAEPLVDPLLVVAIDALRVIQDHTATEIFLPDEMSERMAHRLAETATLLEGRQVARSLVGASVSVALLESDLGPGAPYDLLAGAHAITVVEALDRKIEVAAQQVELQRTLYRARMFRSVRAGSVSEPDANGLVTVSLEPDPYDVYIDRWLELPGQERAVPEAVFQEMAATTQTVPPTESWEALAQRET